MEPYINISLSARTEHRQNTYSSPTIWLLPLSVTVAKSLMMSFTLEWKIKAYSCEFMGVPEILYWHLASNLSSTLHIQKRTQYSVNRYSSQNATLSECKTPDTVHKCKWGLGMMLAADHINSDSYNIQWQECRVCTDVLCWVCGRKQDTQ